MTISMSDSDVARFWAKVALPDENGCMLWTASKRPDGYGQFIMQKQNFRATRIALFLAEGLPPKGRPEAAHACRNRHCCAPSHLRWASKSENMRDRRRDGTNLRGMQTARAKLTDEKIASIRHRYHADGVSAVELAAEFDLKASTIRSVLNRTNWSHVGPSNAMVLAAAERMVADVTPVIRAQVLAELYGAMQIQDHDQDSENVTVLLDRQVWQEIRVAGI